MAIIGLAMLGACAYQYKDWLYYFAILDPHTTNGGTAIVALSAAAGILLTGIVGIVYIFVTGDTKSVLAKMQFNSTALAQTALNSVVERRDEVIQQEFQTPELKERYSDR
jgi:hypothetical protein